MFTVPKKENDVLKTLVLKFRYFKCQSCTAQYRFFSTQSNGKTFNARCEERLGFSCVTKFWLLVKWNLILFCCEEKNITFLSDSRENSLSVWNLPCFQPQLIFWPKILHVPNCHCLIWICNFRPFLGYQPASLASTPRSWSLLEKSWMTSLLSKRAAKLPLTILGDMALLGPMLANRRLVPKWGFFSLISVFTEMRKTVFL